MAPAPLHASPSPQAPSRVPQDGGRAGEPFHLLERHAAGALLVAGLALSASAIALALAGFWAAALAAFAVGVAVIGRAYLRRRRDAFHLADLLAGQTRILELVATGTPLGEVLDALCRLVESQVPDLLCSVLLLENDRLRDVAGPSLAPTYRRAIDDIPIGPDVGSCGSSAYHRRPVVVRDIATDPLWTDYRDVAVRHGLLACWSAPILTADAACLGTFAMYYREPRRPGVREWRLLETATQIARIAIVRARTEQALAASRRRLEEETEVANALARVGQGLISSLDKPGILDRLCQLTTELLGCDSSTTILLEAQQDLYVPHTAHGHPADAWAALRTRRYPAAQLAPLLARVAAAPVVTLLSRSAAEGIERGLLDDLGPGACLLVPLRHGGETLGLLCAGLRDPVAEFLPVQERVAFGIAQFASLAFDNARLVEELENATRLQLEFTSTISHELRTPLGVMLGYAEMLGDEQVPAQRADLVAKIRRTGVELLDLIDATLNLNRLEAGQDPPRLEPVELREFFADLSADFAALPRPAGVELSWQAGDALSLITDRRKLRMILKNLVGNALKFTPAGSVTVRYLAQAELCSFEVRDTGVGIQPEQLPVIFDMFRQADGSDRRSYGGVGLGLYIVRRLATQLGGEVRVTSAPGSGSVFTVVLPRRRSDARLSA